MDGGNTGGTLANIGGRVIGGLLAANDIQRGGFMNYMANRNALLQDPGVRGGLGPFGAGLLEVGGQAAPQVPPGIAANIMQRAGIRPGQFVPNLPPLAPDAQINQALTQAGMGVLRGATPEQMHQAGMSFLGVKPTYAEMLAQIPGNWKPTMMNLGTGNVQVRPTGMENEPLVQTNVPGIFRDPITGRPVRAPTQPGAKSDEAKTEFQLYLKDPEAWRKLQQEKNVAATSRAETTTAAREAAKLDSLTSTTRTMIERAPSVIGLIDDAEKQMNETEVGPAAGRWQLWTQGQIGLSDPAFAALRSQLGLLHTALLQMHVGARGGEMMLHHFEAVVGDPRQSPDNLRAELDVVRRYANTKLAEGAASREALRKRSGLSPPGMGPAGEPAPGGGVQPGVQDLGDGFSVEMH